MSVPLGSVMIEMPAKFRVELIATDCPFRKTGLQHRNCFEISPALRNNQLELLPWSLKSATIVSNRVRMSCKYNWQPRDAQRPRL